MKGYKIAIGVDTVTGPFLCIVELETLEESTIIEPTKKVSVHSGTEYVILNEKEGIYYVSGPLELTKYRTDMAKVVSVKPLEDMPEECWNKIAYSVWDIYNMLDMYNMFDGWGYLAKDEHPLLYKAGQMISANLNMDKEEPCGAGIHFFASEENAKRWAEFDPANFVISVLNQCRSLWESTTGNFVKKLCDF